MEPAAEFVGVKVMARSGRKPAEWSSAALFRSFGLGFPEYFFYLMLHASRRRDAGLAQEMETVGLTLPKWRALAVIRRLGTCTMSELAHLSPVDRTTLTRTVDQLVEAGMVERSTSPTDRRRVLLTLNRRGLDAVERARANNRDFGARALAGIPEDQRETAMAVIQRVIENLIDDDDIAYAVLTYSAPRDEAT